MSQNDSTSLIAVRFGVGTRFLCCCKLLSSSKKGSWSLKSELNFQMKIKVALELYLSRNEMMSTRDMKEKMTCQTL